MQRATWKLLLWPCSQIVAKCIWENESFPKTARRFVAALQPPNCRNEYKNAVDRHPRSFRGGRQTKESLSDTHRAGPKDHCDTV